MYLGFDYSCLESREAVIALSNSTNVRDAILGLRRLADLIGCKAVSNSNVGGGERFYESNKALIALSGGCEVLPTSLANN